MAEIPARHRELVELLLRGRGGHQETTAEPTAWARLSRAQQRLWFLEQRYPGTAQNNIAFQLDFDDVPDRAELEGTFARLQDLHPALRLKVSGSPDQPVQEVIASCAAPLEWHDLTSHGQAAVQVRADELTADAARRPLDLSTPPLYRATAISLPGGTWRLVLVFHHLVVDGWSVGVLFEDLARLLSGKEVVAPATTFLDWVAKHDDGACTERVRAYWSDRFQDSPAAGTLALREGGADDSGLRGGLIPFDIGADLAAELRALAGRLGVTAYALCLAALKVVLRRFADSSAVVVGSPTAGRDDPALDRVVGFFVRTLALRTDIALDDRFADVARRVHEGTVAALDHQPMPFDELVELAGASGAESANPLFRTMFAWMDATSDTPEWNGRLRDTQELDTGTAKFDLTFAFTGHADGISGGVEWAERATDESAARGALEAFLTVLRLVVRDPEARVDTIALAEPVAREPVGQKGTGAPLSLADGLFRQADHTPGAAAVVDEHGGTLDYAELADRVARAAERLRRAGVRPGDRVALFLERSVDLIVAVHAVTAAGCGYVPIDTTAPPARIVELITGADIRTVLCHGASRSRLPDGPWQVLDAADDPLTPAQRRTTPIAPGGYSHLLHTSGSTGTPKLVAFPADAQQGFLDWLQDRMPLNADDRVLLKTPYGFDVSLWELFWPLQNGATLVVAEPTGHSDPAYLAELIRRERVTVVNFVPSILEHFLDEPASVRCTTLRYVLSAGEALTPALRDRVHTRLPATLVNLYGPTETNAVTAHICATDDDAEAVPIGIALPHARIHVLDALMHPVPTSLPGELYIGGDLGTAIGYWGQSALTAERFVPDPFAEEPGRRLYRTGDAGRQLSDGGYEYLGRLDRQVKLHGVRIEPAEIEAVLVAHPSVASARVLVLGEETEAELVSFCTCGPDGTVDVDGLRAWAVTKLPRQLVPRTLKVLERLPLNANGKTDTSVLTAIWRDDRAVAPCRTGNSGGGTVEQEVLAAFEEVLGHAVPDRESTFFELGGNSLLLLSLSVVVERRTGFRPGIADLARRPTVALLADLVRARSTPDDLVVPLSDVPGAPKLLLLPPASGSALPYVPLAQKLTPALSVLGLNAPGFAGTPPRTVREYVAGLLPTVERLTGDEPVLLAGWSFGGVLAYELGVALSLRGHQPSTVVMFDSWVPAPDGEPHPDDRDGVGFLREHGLIPDGLSASDLQALTAMVAATSEAFREYRPSQGTTYPVHLIRAGHGYPGMVDAGYNDVRGWADVVPQLQISEVAADHFEMLGPTVIGELAEILREATKPFLSRDHSNTEGELG